MFVRHDDVYLVQYGGYAVFLAEGCCVAGMMWLSLSESGLAAV